MSSRHDGVVLFSALYHLPSGDGTDKCLASFSGSADGDDRFDTPLSEGGHSVVGGAAVTCMGPGADDACSRFAATGDVDRFTDMAVNFEETRLSATTFSKIGPLGAMTRTALL